MAAINGVSDAYLNTVTLIEETVVDDILAPPVAAVNLLKNAMETGEVPGRNGQILTLAERTTLATYMLEIMRNDPRIPYMGVQIGTHRSAMYTVQRSGVNGDASLPFRTWTPVDCTKDGKQYRGVDLHGVVDGEALFLTKNFIKTVHNDSSLSLAGW